MSTSSLAKSVHLTLFQRVRNQALDQCTDKVTQLQQELKENRPAFYSVADVTEFLEELKTKIEGLRIK